MHGFSLNMRVWRRSEGGDENQRGEEREMAIELGGSQREGERRKG